MIYQTLLSLFSDGLFKREWTDANNPKGYAVVVNIDGQEVPLVDFHKVDFKKRKIILYTVAYTPNTWWRRILRPIVEEFYKVCKK